MPNVVLKRPEGGHDLIVSFLTHFQFNPDAYCVLGSFLGISFAHGFSFSGGFYLVVNRYFFFHSNFL